jgi:hypothetical protein
MHSRQQKLEIISGKLSATRGMKIDQTNGRRAFTIACLKPIISRAEVSRQIISQF